METSTEKCSLKIAVLNFENIKKIIYIFGNILSFPCTELVIPYNYVTTLTSLEQKFESFRRSGFPPAPPLRILQFFSKAPTIKTDGPPWGVPPRLKNEPRPNLKNTPPPPPPPHWNMKYRFIKWFLEKAQ